MRIPFIPEKYLPSSRFGYTAVSVFIALSFVVGISLLQKNGALPAKNANVSANKFSVNVPADIQKDTDNDGLKDWEEALWGTDPNNPDSDGDETPDGEEIKNERNPLVVGPEDLLSVTGKIQYDENGAPIYLSKTDMFGKDVFANIIALKQAGKLDAGSIESMAETLAQSVLQDPSNTLYGPADIIVTENTSEESLKAYGNAVGAVLLRYTSIPQEGELSIVEKALSAEDAEILKRLDPIIEIYDSVITEMLAIRVPPTMFEVHLTLVNSLAAISQSIRGMQQLISDPISGMASVGLYNYSTDLLTKALTDIRSLLAAKRISFGPLEPGRVFRIN